MDSSERCAVSLAVAATIDTPTPTSRTKTAGATQLPMSGPFREAATTGTKPPEIAKPTWVPSASPVLRTGVGNISA